MDTPFYSTVVFLETALCKRGWKASRAFAQSLAIGITGQRTITKRVGLIGSVMLHARSLSLFLSLCVHMCAHGCVYVYISVSMHGACVKDRHSLMFWSLPSALFETGSLVCHCIRQTTWPMTLQGFACLCFSSLSRSFRITDTDTMPSFV